MPAMHTPSVPSPVLGVFFDLDGTLLDTLSDLALACNTMLEQHGYPVHPLASYRHFVGNGFRKLVERTLPKDRPFAEEDVLALLAEAKSLYRENLWQTTRPYEGIPEMLEALHKQDLVLGILSNKPDAETQALARHFFPNTITRARGSVPGTPLKPDPAALLALVADAGLAPQDVVFVGDTSIDMHTASNAGIRSVGVTWGFRDKDELLNAGANHLVDHPAELIPLLGATCQA